MMGNGPTSPSTMGCSACGVTAACLDCRKHQQHIPVSHGQRTWENGMENTKTCCESWNQPLGIWPLPSRAGGLAQAKLSRKIRKSRNFALADKCQRQTPAHKLQPTSETVEAQPAQRERETSLNFASVPGLRAWPTRTRPRGLGEDSLDPPWSSIDGSDVLAIVASRWQTGSCAACPVGMVHDERRARVTWCQGGYKGGRRAR